ncbi:MAG: hypothetical protein NUW21_14385 [Elusimicrobia bacterium]|nr:hypothetical protein [Elusimicrobiota bacterium]
MPADPALAPLAGLLEAVSAKLTAFGEEHWATRLADDARRLRFGDPGALAHFLSAFGGMGSINDLYICPQNGHRIEEADVRASNERLRRALSDAWELARIQARERE